MQCKNCNYPVTHVVRTRNDTRRLVTSRRRECVKCGNRFTTKEMQHHSTNDDRFPRANVK